jgi:hypothetical protein
MKDYHEQHPDSRPVARLSSLIVFASCPPCSAGVFPTIALDVFLLGGTTVCSFWMIGYSGTERRFKTLIPAALELNLLAA